MITVANFDDRQVGDIWADLGSALTSGVTTAINTGASILSEQSKADAAAKIAATNYQIEQVKLQIAQKQADLLAAANTPKVSTTTTTTASSGSAPGINASQIILYASIGIGALAIGLLLYKQFKKK